MENRMVFSEKYHGIPSWDFDIFQKKYDAWWTEKYWLLRANQIAANISEEVQGQFLIGPDSDDVFLLILWIFPPFYVY